MLEARNVGVVREGKRLLDDVSLSVAPGRLTAVVGPNGAGKSTLLRVLAGEIEPTAGAAFIEGADMRDVPVAKLAARRAVVPQSATLSFPFTVLEVVMLGATVPAFGIRDDAALAAGREALDAVGLGAFQSRMLAGLSGGERQRVHVARALCQLATAPRSEGRAGALLLDEPTASLDLKHQVGVLEVVKRQAEEGCAVLLVIHDLNLAATFADDIVLLSAGKIAARGAPSEILNETLLSDVYGCPLSVIRSADTGLPLALPAAMTRRTTTGAAAE
jgi:iron complex transport system ATP-binding protein